MGRISIPAVVARNENISPERSSSSLDVSKSRRKAPRSQVRKVVRTDSQNEETNISQVMESESTLKESFQEPKGNEKLGEDQDLSGTCQVSSSPQNKNLTLQTLASGGEQVCITANETTVCYWSNKIGILLIFSSG